MLPTTLQKVPNDALIHDLLQAERICFRTEKGMFQKQRPVCFAKHQHTCRINIYPA